MRLLRVAGGVMALAIITVVTVASTGRKALAPHTEPFSGEEVFRGILFGEGEVAARLPALWGDGGIRARFPALSDEQVREAADEVVNRVREVDPTFLDRFGEAVQSGDHVVVAKILDETTAVLREAYADDPIINRDPMSLDGTVLHVWKQVEFWEYVAVYRYAVALEAAFLATAEDEPIAVLLDGSTLSKDLLVNEIVEGLALTA